MDRSPLFSYEFDIRKFTIGTFAPKYEYRRDVYYSTPIYDNNMASPLIIQIDANIRENDFLGIEGNGYYRKLKFPITDSSKNTIKMFKQIDNYTEESIFELVRNNGVPTEYFEKIIKDNYIYRRICEKYQTNKNNYYISPRIMPNTIIIKKTKYGSTVKKFDDLHEITKCIKSGSFVRLMITIDNLFVNFSGNSYGYVMTVRQIEYSDNLPLIIPKMFNINDFDISSLEKKKEMFYGNPLHCGRTITFVTDWTILSTYGIPLKNSRMTEEQRAYIKIPIFNESSELFSMLSNIDNFTKKKILDLVCSCCENNGTSFDKRLLNIKSSNIIYNGILRYPLCDYDNEDDDEHLKDNNPAFIKAKFNSFKQCNNLNIHVNIFERIYDSDNDDYKMIKREMTKLDDITKLVKTGSKIRAKLNIKYFWMDGTRNVLGKYNCGYTIYVEQLEIEKENNNDYMFR